MYGHMNNSVYYYLYGSIVNTYLIKHCNFNPLSSDQIGYVVHSTSHFIGSVAFPTVLVLGLRVTKLGNTSVTYQIGLFEQGSDDVKAVGSFTHVFVDRESRRPSIAGMTPDIRKGLEKLLVKETSKL
ncbi:MAG: hypothetical protein M1829_005930 [Trizodia sp. TS-e1964]|nr:MAG: hypothetical protein M1829_005930 [Trizodia sp. TS-e1964]